MSLWRKLQRGVSQAASEAGKQTTIARKNLEISSVRGDVRRKINELGDEALSLYRAGAIQHEKLAAIVAEIDALEAKAAALETEIADAKSDDGKAAEAKTGDGNAEPAGAPPASAS